MAKIAQSSFHTLKANIVTTLNALSALDVTAGNEGFLAERDRYRNWKYPSEMEAHVNVLVEAISPAGGGVRHTDYQATVNVDLYVIGGCKKEETEEIEGEDVMVLTPANIVAADRLDLLVSQVLFGLTQLSAYDFGLPAGFIARKSAPRLTFNNQGDDQTVGVFAPARFSFDVLLPYTAPDNGATFELDDLTITMEKTLEDISAAFTYSHT